MTDNEIIKAWECCSAPICNCKECPMEGVVSCYVTLKHKTLDLLNRQKAEKERLNKEVDRLSQCVMYHDGQIADAIKNLTEKLYEKIEQNSIFGFAYVTKKEIENVVRELEEIKERF